MVGGHALQLSLLGGGIVAAIVTAGEPALIPLLRRMDVMDVPGVRSSHRVPTPRGGGVPVAAGLAVAGPLAGRPLGLLFAAVVSGFAVLGLADDLTGLRPGPRLAAQLVASLLAAALLVAHSGLAAAPAAIAVLAAALWITGLVNVFNFMDGINGISGVHALACGTWFCLLGCWQGSVLLAVGGAAVAAGGAAFLPWNAPRARVFLGDAGSYALGAALALLAAAAVLRGLPPEVAIGPFGLYLADTAWTLQRRIRAREPFLQPHRTHVYQRLCAAGWSHAQVAAGTGLLTMVLMALSAVSLTAMPAARAAADAAGLAVLACYLRFPVLAHRPRHRARPASRRALAGLRARAAVPAGAPAGGPAGSPGTGGKVRSAEREAR